MTPHEPKTLSQIKVALPWMLTCMAILFCQGALAASNDYYKNVMSEDIHKNCENFSINSSTGVLTADCNAVKKNDTRGNVWWETRQKTIDLDDYLGNNQKKKDELSWNDTDFSDDCRNLSLSIHASGVDLTGECVYYDKREASVGGSGGPYYPDKTVNLNSGIKCDTSNGDLKGR